MSDLSPFADSVLVSSTDLVFTITINRPEKLNALNHDVYVLLGRAIDEFSTSESRVCVIRGAGEKAFVAGADIEQYVGISQDTYREFVNLGALVMKKIMDVPKPVIAAIRGYALGGGLELALHCDLIVASNSSKLGLPEALLGLLPGGAGTQLLPRLIGRVRANDLIMRGRFLSAQEAFDCQMISAVFDDGDFEVELETYISQILKHAPLAQGLIKSLIYEGLELTLEEAIVLEANRTSQLIDTADAREGIAAFVEKRKPKFIGK